MKVSVQPEDGIGAPSCIQIIKWIIVTDISHSSGDRAYVHLIDNDLNTHYKLSGNGQSKQYGSAKTLNTSLD